MTGTFPPPFAFAGGFPPTATPPQFPTPPNMEYPILPAAPLDQPQMQQPPDNTASLTRSNPPDSQPMANTDSEQEMDREEGELTDIEGSTENHQQDSRLSRVQSPQNSRRGSGVGSKQKLMDQSQYPAPKNVRNEGDRHTGFTATQPPESITSELEEGETSSEARASTRDSGSRI